MKKDTKKQVSFQVDRGIRINGKSIFPSDDPKKKTVIPIPEHFAKELARASKGQIVTDKANTKLPEAPKDDDDLDDAFGSDDETDNKGDKS